jgi:hypothetical protein
MIHFFSSHLYEMIANPKVKKLVIGCILDLHFPVLLKFHHAAIRQKCTSSQTLDKTI